MVKKNAEKEGGMGIMDMILRGKGTLAQMDVVALNSAFALYAAAAVDSPQEGLERVRKIMKTRKPWDKLQKLKAHKTYTPKF